MPDGASGRPRGKRSSRFASAQSRRRSKGSRRSPKVASFPSPWSAPIRAHLRNRLKDVENRKDGDDHHKKLAELGDELELALIGAERELANTLYRTGELKDEGRRHIERELDLREAVLANLRTGE